MHDSPPKSPVLDPVPVWKRCLDFDSQDAGHYNDFVPEPLFKLVDGTPKRVLDLLRGRRVWRRAHAAVS
jgi:hypothetical protein